MKIQFSLCWLMVLSLCFASCSKDKENCDPEDKDSPCYAGGGSGIKLLLTEHKINGEVVARYEYDSHNRRTRDILATGIIEYQYNAKGFLSVTSYRDSEGKLTQRDDYTYGPDEKPITMLISNPDDDDFIPIDVQFSYSDRKIQMTHTPRRDDGEVTVLTYSFNEQGNLISIKFEAGGQVYTTNAWSEFDQNPAIGLHGDPNYWRNSKNNAQRFQVTSPLFNLDQKWVYTYNEQGYPIKALVYVDQSESIAEEHIFSYASSI